MRRAAIPALVLLAGLACHGHRVSAAGLPADQDVQLAVTVELEGSYARVDFTMVAPDAGSVWTRSVAFPDAGSGTAAVEATGWSRGPGEYALSMAFLRADGGEGLFVGRFELTGREVVLGGTASFSDDIPNPLVEFDLLERPPQELRLEAASEISGEGTARYIVVNGSARELLAESLTRSLERWRPPKWEPVWTGWGGCDSPPSELPPGHRLALDVGAAACLPKALPEGRYRHAFRFGIEPWLAKKFDAEDHGALIHRAVRLTREFRVSSGQPLPQRRALEDVPIADIRFGEGVWMGGYFAFQLLAPDGGQACVCPGAVVGKERLRAIGDGDRLCLTDNPDAATILCQRVSEGENELGDHPPYGKPWDRGVPAPTPSPFRR